MKRTLIADVEAEYANMNDINMQFRKSFDNLTKWLPNLPLPNIYAQIGALDQSIVIGEKMIGISLDKYMGADYPLYQKYYTADQRKTMTRKYIVPESLAFYLLSIYPMDGYDTRTQIEKDLHMGKVMWVVNKALEVTFFDTPYVHAVGRYVQKHHLEVSKLLADDDYSRFPVVRNSK